MKISANELQDVLNRLPRPQDVQTDVYRIVVRPELSPEWRFQTTVASTDVATPILTFEKKTTPLGVRWMLIQPQEKKL